jgi:membrane protein involved in colicin uptake
VWYGDKDEKIPETGIRWMERVMVACEIKVCTGKDHGLMVCADVVVEVLESLQSQLREGQFFSSGLVKQVTKTLTPCPDERRRKREEREKQKEKERRKQEEEQRRIAARSGHYSNQSSRRER